ncbi:outer membrane protein TolC [Arcicella aurantiaca]|uniref:Outer membrane protein TolC n=1 Tax=Arcicella aurantiaca TaxID=591202 RepID=A0A316E4C4_9BACT|nr:TolC family protein [Arcicella aurantiaca]PWK24498.1 outer membrane protein TolC [Arcicella aurantiaca]
MKYVLLLITTCFVMRVEAQGVLTLDEAVRISLENNYAIKIAKSNQKIADNNNTRGNAGMLPVVTGSANKNYNISSVTIGLFDPNLPTIERSGVANNTGGAGINAVWTLYDGLGMFIARDRLRELQKTNVTQIESAVENSIAQVSNAYYDIIRQSRRVKNLKQGLEISNDRLKLSRDRYEVGQGSKVDFLSAQVDYNEDKAALIAQEQALENSKISLNSLLIRNLQEGFSTHDTITYDKTLSLDILREATVKQNPLLILAEQNKRLAEMEVKMQKSAQLPQIDLVTGYNYNSSNNGAGAPQATKSLQNFAFNYGLRASINIFDGYNQKRRIQNAKIGQEIANLQEGDLRNQLNTALERTYLNYRNALELIKLETENYKIARQNIDIAFERYKVGNSTSYELREVQRNAVVAETRLIEAEYNAKITEIELLRLSSKILE